MDLLCSGTNLFISKTTEINGTRNCFVVYNMVSGWWQARPLGNVPDSHAPYGSTSAKTLGNHTDLRQVDDVEV